MSASEKRSQAEVAVLGMGNELLKDEGIGVHVIRRLEETPGLSGVKLVEGGTSPDVADDVRDVKRLIIVDAAKCGGEPGDVYRMSPEDVQTQQPSSVHELSMIQMLWQMDMLGRLPEVTIIGVEPKEMDWGMDLSPELAGELPKIVEAVREELDRD